MAAALPCTPPPLPLTILQVSTMLCGSWSHTCFWRYLATLACNNCIGFSRTHFTAEQAECAV